MVVDTTTRSSAPSGSPCGGRDVSEPTACGLLFCFDSLARCETIDLEAIRFRLEIII